MIEGTAMRLVAHCVAFFYWGGRLRDKRVSEFIER